VVGALVGGPVGVAIGTRAPGYFDNEDPERRKLRRRNLFLGALSGSAIGGSAGAISDIKREWSEVMNNIERVNRAVGTQKTSSLLESVKNFRPFAPGNINTTGGIGGAALGLGTGAVIGGLAGGLFGRGFFRGAAVGAGVGGVVGGAGGYVTAADQWPIVLNKFKDVSFEKRPSFVKSVMPKPLHDHWVEGQISQATVGGIWQAIKNRRAQQPQK